MENEKRLIDANALVKIAEKRCGVVNIKHIDEQPTVDAVEVVRCKDCIHFDKEKALRPGGIWCTYWGTDPDPDDWCCKGERKDNEKKVD